MADRQPSTVKVDRKRSYTLAAAERGQGLTSRQRPADWDGPQLGCGAPEERKRDWIPPKPRPDRRHREVAHRRGGVPCRAPTLLGANQRALAVARPGVHTLLLVRTDQPPVDVVGKPVGLRFVLGRSDTATVLIENVSAYPTGFTFDLVATHTPHPNSTDRGDLLYGLFGRLGGLFARSSRRAATQNHAWRGDEHLVLHLGFSPGPNEVGPLRDNAATESLTPRPFRAHASTSTIRATYWIHPIPSEGTLTFACEWPVFGIALSSCTVDASPIIAAATQPKPDEASLSEEQSGVPVGGRKPFFVPLRHPPPWAPGVSPQPEPRPPLQATRSVGEPVSISFILARSDRAVIRIRHIVAFPNGFQFEAVATHEPSSGNIWDPMHGLAGLRSRPGDQYGRLSDEHLRLGIEFAGGGTATNAGPPKMQPTSTDARRPSWTYIEGGAATGLVHARFEVSPLPDPGPLAFYCEWPKYGIPLTRHRVEGAAIREAGSRASSR